MPRDLGIGLGFAITASIGVYVCSVSHARVRRDSHQTVSLARSDRTVVACEKSDARRDATKKPMLGQGAPAKPQTLKP